MCLSLRDTRDIGSPYLSYSETWKMCTCICGVEADGLKGDTELRVVLS